MITATELERNLADIKQEIAAAAKLANRDPQTVKLIPASKKVAPETLRIAYDLGLHVFGENRVQEARVKQPLLPTSCDWHFIGGLQSNKAKEAVRLFSLIHSVDSIALAQELDRRAREAGKVQHILLEVNVGGESSKHGVAPDQVSALVEAIFQCQNLELKGFMTVAPFYADLEKVRPYFRRLHEIRDQQEQHHGAQFPELSMGMSHDYKVAIAEGASMVRVGTALFGSRQSATPHE